MTDILVIEPGRYNKNYWQDLWRYRELFYILAWRDVAVRYKQTAIGVGWAVIRPLVTMMIFSVIFGQIAKLPSDGGVPYPLMVFAGMLPWWFFSTGITEGAHSLIGNSNLISKVYFPRLIVPMASVAVGIVDFLIAFLMLIGLMFWYGFLPNWQIVFFPVFVLLLFIATVGPALWLTALNVKYRDFRHLVPFIIQCGLYVSPVGFGSHVVPAHWRLLYSFNPMVGVIDGFRWSLLGSQSELYVPGLAASLGTTILLLWFGLDRFRKAEKSFADLI